MKTSAIRIFAGLLATALPALATAQEDAVPAAPSSNGATTLGSFQGVADTVDSNNLQLHTVQRKRVADGGKHEVVLYPAVAQMNGKFTTHLGAGAQYLYHLHENFALQVMGTYFYVNEQTDFNNQLISTSQQAAPAASALTMQWAATGGFEVTPIYGKFAWFDDTLASFGIVLNAGAGVGSTRVQIQNDASIHGATFGDTGLKFVGQVGGGFRVRLNDSLVLRLEVKDLIYTAKVDSINGCNLKDLVALEEANGGQISASCDQARFKKSAAGNTKEDADRLLARRLIEEPSSDVLNNVGVYGGISYTF